MTKRDIADMVALLTGRVLLKRALPGSELAPIQSNDTQLAAAVSAAFKIKGFL